MNQLSDFLPKELIREIRAYNHYDDYDWGSTVDVKDEKGKVVKMTDQSKIIFAKKILLLSYRMNNFLDYIFYKIARDEVFDLPEAALDEIIEDVPIVGLSQFFKLSEARIEKYKHFFNVEAFSRNPSLTLPLFNKYKKVVMLEEYAKVMNLNDKIIKSIIDAIRKEGRKYLTILQNPQFIDYFDKYYDQIMNLIESHKNKDQRFMFRDIVTNLALNPKINMKIINKLTEDDFSPVLMKIFTDYLKTNKHLSFDIVDWSFDQGLEMENIISYHILDDEFTTRYSDAMINPDYQGYIDRNQTISKKRTLQLIKNKEWDPYFENTLIRFDLLVPSIRDDSDLLYEITTSITRDAITPRYYEMLLQYKSFNIEGPISYNIKKLFEGVNDEEGSEVFTFNDLSETKVFE